MKLQLKLRFSILEGLMFVAICILFQIYSEER